MVTVTQRYAVLVKCGLQDLAKKVERGTISTHFVRVPCQSLFEPQVCFYRADMKAREQRTKENTALQHHRLFSTLVLVGVSERPKVEVDLSIRALHRSQLVQSACSFAKAAFRTIPC